MFEDLFSTISFIDPAPGVSTVGDIVNVAANVAIIIAFGLSVVAIAVSLIKIVTSSGDPKRADSAKNSLLWGVIGAFFALIAHAIKGILLDLTGVPRDIMY